MKTIRRYNFAGLLYISPWVVGFVGLTLVPFLSTIVFSFTHYSVLSRPYFIGLQNFVEMFTTDDLFPKALQVTGIYVLISVPLKLAFALLVAVILNQRLKGIGAYRTLYYLPSIFGGSVALSILWRMLFMDNGLINKFLAILSIHGPAWLGDARFALPTISLLSVWQFGSSMVLFLAGLKQVPEFLYEAAKIDGAGRLRVFRMITFPLITPIVFFNLIMQTINAFQDFTAAFVITSGGPLHATYLYALLLYDNAFRYFRMGYASALAWFLFVVLLAVTSLVFRSSPYWLHYQETEQ
ncbi:MAG TPA: sugar ABC transporter permease [Spirochaetia bacterium]|nr:sugar ABC transporter permease [Spirochaetia bacterium]